MNIHFKIKKYLHVADGTYMNPHTEIERRWQNKKPSIIFRVKSVIDRKG
jgi:hypothetical protein